MGGQREGSPERACARAKVHPHRRAQTVIAVGTICSIGADHFQSRSWRT
jgi:hypothetical protein